jgi:hypothetical protein
LIEQEGHLLATLVELALRPPLHWAGARHWVLTGIDAQLELQPPAVRGQAGGRAGKHVIVLGEERGGVGGVAISRR